MLSQCWPIAAFMLALFFLPTGFAQDSCLEDWANNNASLVFGWSWSAMIRSAREQEALCNVFDTLDVGWVDIGVNSTAIQQVLCLNSENDTNPETALQNIEVHSAQLMLTQLIAGAPLEGEAYFTFLCKTLDPNAMDLLFLDGGMILAEICAQSSTMPPDPQPANITATATMVVANAMSSIFGYTWLALYSNSLEVTSVCDNWGMLGTALNIRAIGLNDTIVQDIFCAYRGTTLSVTDAVSKLEQCHTALLVDQLRFSSVDPNFLKYLCEEFAIPTTLGIDGATLLDELCIIGIPI